jgi:hypothetical protein
MDCRKGKKLTSFLFWQKVINEVPEGTTRTKMNYIWCMLFEISLIYVNKWNLSRIILRKNCNQFYNQIYNRYWSYKICFKAFLSTPGTMFLCFQTYLSRLIWLLFINYSSTLAKFLARSIKSQSYKRIFVLATHKIRPHFIDRTWLPFRPGVNFTSLLCLSVSPTKLHPTLPLQTTRKYAHLLWCFPCAVCQ